MSYAIMMDVVLGGLLAATIFYTTRLYKKMADLKLYQQNLQQLAAQFTNATETAQQAISVLKETTEQSGGLLESHIRKAHTLKEDLNFISDRAASLATTLEENIKEARKAKNDLALLASTIAGAKKPQPIAVVATTETQKPARRGRASKAETELLAALENRG
jgi:hypothetical protein